MSEDLQRMPPIGANWSAQPVPRTAVELMINVPDHAEVLRNTLTGQVQIKNLQIEDLISLRDALTEQITTLQQQKARNGWEPL